MLGLEWNVWVEDVNSGEIKPYNIFLHRHFTVDCAGIFREFFENHNMKWLRERLEHTLRYWFWSKCEWEIVLSGWPASPKTEEKKVDVYSQVAVNFERFFDYLCDNSDAFSPNS